MSILFTCWLAGVVATDFARRRVSNRWVLAGALLAIAALAVDRSPVTPGWRDALAGGAAAFVVLLAFYAMGLMGAGDVKFAGVLGLWLGGAPLLPIATGAGLLAGIHALFCLARAWARSIRARRTAGAGATASLTRADAGAGIPYAGYLASMALLWTLPRLGTAAP